MNVDDETGEWIRRRRMIEWKNIDKSFDVAILIRKVGGKQILHKLTNIAKSIVNRLREHRFLLENLREVRKTLTKVDMFGILFAKIIWVNMQRRICTLVKY